MNARATQRRAGISPANRPRVFAFMISALPFGAIGLVVLTAGWALTLATAGSVVLAPLSVAVLIGFAAAVRLVARTEASIARSLLGTSTATTASRALGRGWWHRATVILTDRAFRKAQLYLALRILVGWPSALVTIIFIATGLGAITAPLYYRWIPLDAGRPNGLDFAIWQADTTAKACLLVVPGFVVLFIAVASLRWHHRLWASWADALLARRPTNDAMTMDTMTRTRSHGATAFTKLDFAPPTSDDRRVLACLGAEK
jgi:Putative sensor